MVGYALQHLVRCHAALSPYRMQSIFSRTKLSRASTPTTKRGSGSTVLDQQQPAYDSVVSGFSESGRDNPRTLWQSVEYTGRIGHLVLFYFCCFTDRARLSVCAAYISKYVITQKMAKMLTYFMEAQIEHNIYDQQEQCLHTAKRTILAK